MYLATSFYYISVMATNLFYIYAMATSSLYIYAMATSFFYICAMATSFFYIHVMATSSFYIYVMATSFFYIYKLTERPVVLLNAIFSSVRSSSVRRILFIYFFFISLNFFAFLTCLLISLYSSLFL